MTIAPSMSAHWLWSFCLGFSAFWAFPAMPVGNTAAIEIPSVIAAFMLIGSFRTIAWSDIAPFLMLVAPVVVSALLGLMGDRMVAPEVAFRSGITSVAYFALLVPASWLIRRGLASALLAGACLAIPLHALIGVVQEASFAGGEFPFFDIMATNPGMAMDWDKATNYAQYTRRPFGLFAEPSAMAACVGPWLTLLAGTVLLPALKGGLGRGRWLAVVAIVSGIVLLVVSQSGQAIIVIVAIGLLIVSNSLSLPAGPARRRAVALHLAGTFVAVSAMMWFVVVAESRLDVSENLSWQSRAASLLLAIDSLSDGWNFLTGVGPGQSHVLIVQTTLGALLRGDQTAVSSVSLTYLMETGLLGMTAFAFLGWRIRQRITTSTARLLGWACGGVWLSGVTLATSYVQQPALWTFLAVLLNWDSVAGDEAGARPLLAERVRE